MKLYQKIIIVVVVSLITILGGVVNWINQFLIVGVAFFVSTFFLIDNKFKKWITIVFLLAPFLLVYGGGVLYNGLFSKPLVHVYPIVFISIINTLLGIGFKLLYLKYFNKQIIVFASLYLLLFIAGGYIFMHNWLNYVFDKKYATQTEKLSDMKIWDFLDNEIKLDEIENKVIVLDFWNIFCGECFKKFPDLEKIKNYYQNKDVVIYAVYIPMFSEEEESANIGNRLQWIEEHNFTFSVVKTDTLTAHKIGIKGVPHILIFDKNKKIVLDGGFVFKENRFVMNNLYSVIDKSLKQ
jgi:thiol-disulfide isomerase/thioredoxin